MPETKTQNIDAETVIDFGQEWQHFNQSSLSEKELANTFAKYFQIFPFELLNKGSIGIDIGCGSGRWAKLMAPKVGKLYCLDASSDALQVAKKNLSRQDNAEFILASVDNIPLPDQSLDFAYSLGVLHHIPDTALGIRDCVMKLKKGAPFLVYLYYAFDNKPIWFRLLWRISDYLRRGISKLPFKLKLIVTQVIAGLIYFPLARLALLCEKFQIKVDNFPLSAYRNSCFYFMRTDSLDRFGTKLEHRFTRNEIISMFKAAGLVDIKVGTQVPYWTVIGYKG